MQNNELLRITTRKSPLALFQANYVKEAILDINHHIKIDMIGLLTEGDRKLTSSLAKEGGKGLFIKELQTALLDQKADIAVHSLKDMPVQSTPGLDIIAICIREDARDAFLSPHPQYSTLDALPPGATIGTSSQRRAALLHTLRPDLLIKPLRGNVGTRLEKLDQGQYDGIILAAAGLNRLGLSDRIRSYLEKEEWIPAVGQGAIGIECRSDDLDRLKWLLPLDHAETRCCITAERAFNQALNGGCELPIAAHAVFRGDQLNMNGFVFQKNKSYRAALTGSIQEPKTLGKQLASLFTHAQ